MTPQAGVRVGVPQELLLHLLATGKVTARGTEKGRVKGRVLLLCLLLLLVRGLGMVRVKERGRVQDCCQRDWNPGGG